MEPHEPRPPYSDVPSDRDDGYDTEPVGDAEAAAYDGVTAEGDDAANDIDDDALGDDAVEQVPEQVAIPAGSLATGDTSEVVDPPAEESEPDAIFPHGGLRGALHAISEQLRARGVEARDLLDEDDQGAFDALTDPARSNQQIRDEFTLTPSRLSRLSRAIVERVVERAPEDALAASAEPGGSRWAIEAPETVATDRVTLAKLASGMSAMGVELSSVLSDGVLREAVGLLTQTDMSYVDVAHRLGVNPDAVPRMIRGVVKTVSERVPGLAERLLGPEEVSRVTSWSADVTITNRWSRGDVPRALDAYRERFAEGGHEATDFLPAKAHGLRAAASLLLDTSLDDAAIAERLGITESHANGMRRRLVDTLGRTVPEEVFPADQRPKPDVRVGTEAHVGAQVGGLIRAAGLTPTRLARELGIPQPRMSRLISGATHPNIDEVLVPILERLGVAQEVAETLMHLYDVETRQQPGEDR